MSRFIVVTGGARSGKSRLAESRVAELAPGGPWLYIATAEAGDDEMRARIAQHQRRRGDDWRTVEAARDVAAALARDVGDARAVLIDCATLWLSNRMFDGLTDDAILAEADTIAAVARAAAVPVLLVTNEVGAGIVPDNPVARRFRDLAGWVNQRVAGVADEVVLVACGLPLRLR
ncbi:MAG TPA: bifunctional adenosylcobinamide kinase/adenosylcobinamide-phosphate guanylyltransferase [Polyangia bacterium]|jgi:adenosylcobinamide kinase/adenosylcobinamide-phosphate guanylyltransferase|nr:bifunctional adenosylcobinamide kinase/adenosylcobinamide-phosphate guanylyltransferase [Polyangia bacterium]